jgi:hypothetical protein
MVCISVCELLVTAHFSDLERMGGKLLTGESFSGTVTLQKPPRSSNEMSAKAASSSLEDRTSTQSLDRISGAGHFSWRNCVKTSSWIYRLTFTNSWLELLRREITTEEVSAYFAIRSWMIMVVILFPCGLLLGSSCKVWAFRDLQSGCPAP